MSSSATERIVDNVLSFIKQVCVIDTWNQQEEGKGEMRPSHIFHDAHSYKYKQSKQVIEFVSFTKQGIVP
ncbi:hypothetical protein MASR1M36_21600 [Candidatus Cloacimonadaceae bacterium]